MRKTLDSNLNVTLVPQTQSDSISNSLIWLHQNNDLYPSVQALFKKSNQQISFFENSEILDLERPCQLIILSVDSKDFDSFQKHLDSILLKREHSEVLVHLNSGNHELNRKIENSNQGQNRITFIDSEANEREFKLLIPVLISKALLRHHQVQETKGNFISLKGKSTPDQDLSSLIACGMAHDVNNILTAIQGRVWYLEKIASIQDHDNYSITPKQAFLDVSRWILKIKALLKQLIVLKKEDAFKQESISLNEVLTSALELANSLICDSVKVSLHLPEQKFFCLGDATLLEQVILNLCINAKNAIFANGQLEVKLKQNVKFDDEYYHMITLQDNGKGMKESHLEQIFDPFFSIKQNSQGHGLGLFMCKQIIEKHSGFIEVESELNKGTLFKIYLPKCKSNPLDSRIS
ncbi:ATP-binding protein [bacterium]|nr:ATP-binding protein [bacterium]